MNGTQYVPIRSILVRVATDPRKLHCSAVEGWKQNHTLLL